MNGKKLMDAIENIDDKHIEKYAEPKPARKNVVWKRLVLVAACVALIAAAVPLALHYISPSENPVEPGKRKEFVIENGVLLDYNGEGEEVIIPDDVISIANGAFDNSNKIVKLKIGKNTTEIGNAVFSSLKHLETVEVAAENKAFSSTGRILVSDGGKLAFVSIGAWKEEQYDFIIAEAIREMTENGYSAEDMSKLCVGSAILSVKTVTAAETVYPIATAVEVYGKTVELSEPVQLVLNGAFKAFETSECFVISSSTYGVGKTYIVTKDANCIVAESPIFHDADKAYDDIIVSFFEKDGALCYHKQPRKYYIHQADGSYMQYCTSLDEMFEEEGTVALDGGEIFYNPTKTVSVRDAIDVEAEFNAWKKVINLPENTTVEDWLKENAE